MEKNKFRNHFSVVFENAARSIMVLFFIFVGNFMSGTEDMEDLGFQTVYLVITLCGILVVLLGWQILLWAKTYICIKENTLIVERNTINKKKNTIGLKNVSNVNLEQNLFEMLIGTCKVKIDTNSLSTADQTDVKIVLKKKDAELLKQMILGVTSEASEQYMEAGQRKYMAAMDDIAVHGLFSLNLFSVVALAGVVLGVIGGFSEISLDAAGDGIIEIIFTILVAIWLIAGLVWNVVKGFVQYLDFKIERRGDKIFLNYGLLKKVAYSIPVDKINGICFVQTGLARLGKRYMVEVINVGLDDDEEEARSFFLPYASKERIEARLQMLLPEFEGCMEIKEEKQPKEIWLIWIPKAVIYLGVMALGFAGVAELLPGAKVPVLIGIGVVSLLLVISKTASYLTEGVAVNERFMKIVDGSFGRRILVVKYDKIQYVTAKQNPIAKIFGLQKGEIHLLAAMKNQIHSIPYFKERDMEVLKDYII